MWIILPKMHLGHSKLRVVFTDESWLLDSNRGLGSGIIDVVRSVSKSDVEDRPMLANTRIALLAGITLSGVWMTPFGLADEASAKKQAAKTKDKDDVKRITVKEARARAELLHEVYEATLQIMHRRYFREDAKVTIPSKALDDVFYRVSLRTKVKARWLAINARAMSVDHAPKDAFEKQAARALGSGKESHEVVEDGLYRRAGSITLFGSCIKCHAPAPMNLNVRRYAGLVISIPVHKN